MEENLVVEVLLKVLPVEVITEEFTEEIVAEYKLQLDLRQEEIDAWEARWDLSTALDCIHLGEAFDLCGVGILR